MIDDSYNASPDSIKSGIGVLMAVKSTGKKIAVLADMLELGERSAQAHLELGASRGGKRSRRSGSLVGREAEKKLAEGPQRESAGKILVKALRRPMT
ncbi:MAG: glutamate ligase domain-containing protein [[Clostridium] leptum]